MRTCKRCGRTLSDDEIVCRACSGSDKSQESSSNLHGISVNQCSFCGANLRTEWEKNNLMCVDCHNRLDPEDSITMVKHTENELKPRSLGGLNDWAVTYRIYSVLFVLAGIFVGWYYCSQLGGDVEIAIIIGAIIASVGAFYSMVSTLFRALYDIVKGIYHIANNKGE